MSALVGSRTVELEPDLKGDYQVRNIRSVVALMEILNTCGLSISDSDIREGIDHTALLSGLRGRWQQFSTEPTVICDTAHNPEGIAWVAAQALACTSGKIRWVIGLVADKDARKIIHELPKEAQYYFCQAQSPRALDAERLAALAAEAGLNGSVVRDVNQAVEIARNESASDDLVLICGSNYIVAELHNL